MRSMRISMDGFPIILLLLYSLFSMLLTFSSAGDTINTTQFIKDGQTMVSSDGTFELGFFSPANSKNRYLGIWYRKVSYGTVVWVANREKPITADASGGGGALRLTSQGILTLFNGTNSVLWSSNSSRSTVNPVVQILESGNLVVKDANDDNPKNYLWQSFDYPCDTLLPGMKLGLNKTSGMEWHLRSWKTSSDPSRGDFTYQIDPHGFPQFLLMNGSIEQYRSGPWNGIQFSGSPGLRPNTIYTYHFEFNQEEIYYHFELVNSAVSSRLVLNPNGILQRFTWNNRTQRWIVYLTAAADTCDIYALCGAYGSCNIGSSPVCRCLNKFVPKYPQEYLDSADWSNGCVRRTDLNCKNGDGFLKYSSVKMPDTQSSWFNRTMSLDECRSLCWANCSCMAYANIDITDGGKGCMIWFDELIDIREYTDGGQDLYVRVASSELGSSPVPQAGSNGKKRETMIISLTLLTGAFLIALSLTLYVHKKKKRRRQQQQQQQTQIERRAEPDFTLDAKESKKEELELPLLDFATIANATNYFSINNKLGEGGFGPVYKGMLETGQEIAVKRLSKESKQGIDEFTNEVHCIAKLQHRNLVKLLSYCIQGEEKMLIYEYMPNGSLDAFIFDQTQSKKLGWPERFRIINGIARGLLYLHQDSRLRVIHRDLKASNVLLDFDMNPKISDFGTARSFGGNEMQANTKRVIGTHGYMSPEYMVDGLFSVKSDVFSFGVLVLEIISGRKNRGFSHPDHKHNLLGHAWRLYNEGMSLELVDASLGDSAGCVDELLRTIQVGLLCVQQRPEDRPSMSTVALMLGSDGSLPPPKQPGFFTERNINEGECSSSNYAASSANEVTITLLDPR